MSDLPANGFRVFRSTDGSLQFHALINNGVYPLKVTPEIEEMDEGYYDTDLKPIVISRRDEFREEDHPRAEDGRFGTKSGSSGGSSEKEPEAGATEARGGGAKEPGKGHEPGSSKASEHAQNAVAGYHPMIAAAGMDHAVVKKKEWRATAPKTFDDIMAAAKVNQDALVSAAEGIAKARGMEMRNPGAKTAESLKKKLDRGKAPEQVTDAVRLGFDAPTPEDGDAILNELAKHFEVADEGWSKTPTGYFDRAFMVRFSDGQVGEVQIWPPGMFEAKEFGGGHDLYKKWQDLPNQNGPEGLALEKQMIEFYGEVEAKLDKTWGSLFRERRKD